MRYLDQKGKLLCVAALAAAGCGLGQTAAASDGVCTCAIQQFAGASVVSFGIPLGSPGLIAAPSDAGYEAPNSWYRNSNPINGSFDGIPEWVSSSSAFTGGTAASALADSTAANAPSAIGFSSTTSPGNAALGTIASNFSSGGARAVTLSSDSSYPSVTVGGKIDLTQSGQGSYTYTGFTPKLDISANVPLAANVTFNPNDSGITGANDAWGAPANWGAGGLGLSILDAGIVTTAIAGDIKGDFSINDNLNALSVMENDGPTQKTESLGLGTVTLGGSDASEVQGFPSAGINVSANFIINFNVTIPDHASAVMNQSTVNLLNLTIDQGGYLYSNADISGSTFVVQQTLSNSGTLNDLGGTVEGQLVNYGSLTLGAGLTVQGLLGNYSPGIIYVPTSTALTATGGMNNAGELSVDGGVLNISSGAQTNSGLLHVSDGGSIDLGGGSTLNNSGEIEADGGILNLGNATVANTGKVVALAGGVVNLSGGTISGGSLNFDSASVMNVSGTSTLANVISNAAINVPGQWNGEYTLNIKGNLVDNGMITVGSNQGASDAPSYAVLNVAGGTVSGTGTINLNNNESYGPCVAQLSGTLTQATGHSITGFGQINATLTNNGTVNADVNVNLPGINGQTLEVLPPSGADTLAVTNNGLMEATNGGTLQFDKGVTLTSAAGATITADNGTINFLSGTTVADDGLIQAISKGTIDINGAVNEGSGLPMQINSGTLNISGGTINQTGSQLNVAGGTVNLSSGTISGGSLNFDSASVMNVSGTSTLANVISNAAINVPGQWNGEYTLNIKGNLVDNGMITVGSNQGASDAPSYAVLNVAGGTVSGTGTINLNNNESYGPCVAQLSGTLTQATGHSITGFGQINATLTNNGTVNADVNVNLPGINGQTLEVLPPSGADTLAVTNNGLMEATNGGTLQFDNGVNLINNGTIEVSNGTITSPTAIQVGTGTLLGGGTINAPVVLSNDPSTLEYVIGGTASPGDLIVNGNVTLGGNLTIRFANGLQNLVTNLDMLTVLTASGSNTLSGQFLNVADGGRLETADGFGSFQVNYGDSIAPNSVVLSNFVDGGGSVPEPATLALLAAGVAYLGLLRRRCGRIRPHGRF